jgi:3',5'-cyclic-AMP phosphodiesterase
LVVVTFLLAQLSDPHVRVGPHDGGASAALEEAVRCLVALDRVPDAVLVSGDLVDHANEREYERVVELLAPLSMPVHVLAGNHDDRDALRAHFGGGVEDGLFRYVTRVGPLRLVGCDTTEPGREEGSIAGERLAWLEAQLQADRETPTVVAMHHPPLLTGIGPLDEIGLPDSDRVALGELLARHPQVRRVVSGHVHRTAVSQVGGRVVLACPSTYLQAELDLREAGKIAMVPEPPGFALHWARDGELTSHVQPVGEWPPVPQDE